MIRHYLKMALRNLQRYRLQTVICIVGLSVGFVCFTLCSYTFRISLNWNKGLMDSERLYRIQTEEKEQLSVNSDRLLSEALLRELPEVESQVAISLMMPYIRKNCEITTPGNAINYHEENFVIARIDALDFFGIELLAGDPGEIAGNSGSLLLTESAARKLFGTTDVVGKSFVDIDDFHDTRTTCYIRGVIRDFPKQTFLSDYSGMEINHPQLEDPGNWLYYNAFNTYVKLRKGTDMKGVNNKLAALTIKYDHSGETKEAKVCLLPETERRKEVWEESRLYFLIGSCVLLIAILNFLLFTFGRLLNRIRESALRKVCGSGRAELFSLFSTEAVVSYTLSCLFGLLIIRLFFPILSVTGAYYGTPDFAFVYICFGQYFLSGILLILLVSWVATRRLIRLPIIGSINENVFGRSHNGLRNLFITIQIAVCLLFLGGSWFLYSQGRFMESRLNGKLDEEEQKSTYLVHMSGDRLDPVRGQIFSFLRQKPGVVDFSRNGMDLFAAWRLGNGYFSWEGITGDQQNQKMSYIITDANFPAFVNTEPLEGRFFTREEEDKAVVNESFVRLYGRNPIGDVIRISRQQTPYLIVGVFPDITTNQYQPREGFTDPCIYIPYPDGYMNLSLYVKVLPSYRDAFPVEMEAELRKYLSPVSKVHVRNLKENAGYIMEEENNFFTLISVFTLICVLITLLGMYASIILATEKRRREVAVRKIHGASVARIIRMFCTDYLILLLVAASIAFPLLHYLVVRKMEEYAEHISVGPLPFILLFVFMLLFITLISIWNIISLSRVNPAEAMKRD